jgi:hypothetical protein
MPICPTTVLRISPSFTVATTVTPFLAQKKCHMDFLAFLSAYVFPRSLAALVWHHSMGMREITKVSQMI